MKLSSFHFSSIISSPSSFMLLLLSFLGVSTIINSEAFAFASSTTTTQGPLSSSSSHHPTFIGRRIISQSSTKTIMPATLLRRSKSPIPASTRSSGITTTSSTSTSLNLIHKIVGGGTAVTTSAKNASLFSAASGNDKADTCPFTKAAAGFGSVWGSFGVIYILAKAIFRVLPIAMEPFGSSSSLAFTPIQWSLYAMSCLFFAYAEGYKGFHLKFAPLVVKRSFTLVFGTRQGNNPINYVLAPLYSMGLFCATKKRLIVSWSVSIGVAMIVAAVKKLSPVPRCILDAGVVVGLSIGSLSILYHYIQSILTGKLPDLDPCLPSSSSTTATKAE